jgi:hypothetical protein
MKGRALETNLKPRPAENPAHRELEALVHRVNTFFNTSVQPNLEALSPLRGAALDEAFEELCRAVDLRDGVQSGSVHWSEVVPDASGIDRDGQALDAARTFVELALDRLTGGAS